MDTEKFKMGWLAVYFDLPVMTRNARKSATLFRKFLLDEGYLMIQYSVYARPCVTFARQQTHIRRLKQNLPPNGSIRAIFIIRSQWERQFCMQGTAPSKPPEKMPEQLTLW